MIGSTIVDGGFAHAVLWQNGTMTDLGSLGGKETEAYAINDRGQIVGHSQTKGGHTHAFLWQNGTMRDLTPVAALDSHAIALNEQGQIVGTISTKKATEAVMWTLTTARPSGP